VKPRAPVRKATDEELRTIGAGRFCYVRAAAHEEQCRPRVTARSRLSSERFSGRESIGYSPNPISHRVRALRSVLWIQDARSRDARKIDYVSDRAVRIILHDSHMRFALRSGATHCEKPICRSTVNIDRARGGSRRDRGARSTPSCSCAYTLPILEVRRKDSRNASLTQARSRTCRT